MVRGQELSYAEEQNESPNEDESIDVDNNTSNGLNDNRNMLDITSIPMQLDSTKVINNEFSNLSSIID